MTVINILITNKLIPIKKLLQKAKQFFYFQDQFPLLAYLMY